MAPGLSFRIFEHLKEIGWLKPNSLILDPLAGIGTTALVACSLGLKAITVELEPKFTYLSRKNKAYLEAKIHKTLDWTVLQGDSRKLSQILSEKGLVTIMSPPYGNQEIVPGSQTVRCKGSSLSYPESGVGYSSNPSNIGNLVDKPLTVMSPPYESGGHHGDAMRSWGGQSQGTQPQYREGYGDTVGQVKGDESYLSAMSQVYSEIAKVSNILVVVLKNPTRNGKLRRLDLDTLSLLKAGGWTIHCVHKAMLFEETEIQDLFGQSYKKVKGRMSFFKRLSYQKGQPVARWEDVIFAVREGNGFISVTSPPYEDSHIADRSAIKGDTFHLIGTDKSIAEGYGYTPGQIGNLRDRV